MTNAFTHHGALLLPLLLKEANLRTLNTLNETLAITDADLLNLRPDFYPAPDDQLHSIPFTDDNLLEFEEFDADSDVNWSLVVGPGSRRTESEWELGGDMLGEGEGGPSGQGGLGRSQRGRLAAVREVLQIAGRVLGTPNVPAALRRRYGGRRD
jgi:hypothetical protein